MASGYSPNTLLNAMPEVRLVGEVGDVHDVLPPVLHGVIPDVLHWHELTAVRTVVDEGHVVLSAHLSQLGALVYHVIVQYKGARFLCHFKKASNELIEGVRDVTLLFRLTEDQLTSVVGHSDGSNCLKGELRPTDGGPLYSSTRPYTLLTL